MPKHDNQFLPIRLGSSHAFFIPTRMGAVLIDAGNAHKMTQLRSVLHAHEYNLSDITHIIITHTHHDHVGSLAELQKRTGARIIVHESEADYLRTGRTPLPRGVTPYAKALVSMGRIFRFGRYQPAEPDILAGRQLDLSEIGVDGSVLHTPGHTCGSMSIILNSGIAFVGDTLFNFQPETVFPPFANDLNALLQSWRVLIEADCTTYYPAHGKPIEREKFMRCWMKWQKKLA